MTTAYVVLALICLPSIVILINNWRQAILKRRVAQALQNFGDDTQAQIEGYFKSKGWRIPKNFATKLAVMEERGLLAWRKGKESIVYKLTEPGKKLLPKPKVEVPAVTPNFDERQFTKSKK